MQKTASHLISRLQTSACLPVPKNLCPNMTGVSIPRPKIYPSKCDLITFFPHSSASENFWFPFFTARNNYLHINSQVLCPHDILYNRYFCNQIFAVQKHWRRYFPTHNIDLKSTMSLLHYGAVHMLSRRLWTCRQRGGDPCRCKSIIMSFNGA